MSRPYLDIASRLAVAALVGLAIGMERVWSGHASGPRARFAGARTFFLLGLLGGVAGWLVEREMVATAVLLLGGGVALSVAAYVMGVIRTRDIDGTTETGALVVLALGVAAGLGYGAIAGGGGAVVVLALAEKTRIHSFVRRIGEQEMRAALYFAVLALVVLPVLPEGPYGPLGGIRPRALWTVVLIFCGLNFAGYLARRAVGEHQGYAITGLLGGLISSTAVTLAFSRQSRDDRVLSPALGLGVLAACTMLIPRLLVVTLVLNAPLVAGLALYLLPPFLVGAGFVAAGLARAGPRGEAVAAPPAENPLRFLWAVRMALAFQVVLMAVHLAEGWFGSSGILGSAAVLGLTDTDAVTYSMIQLAQAGAPAALATKAIAISVLSNTLLKLALTLVFGSGPFRRVASWGLLALTAGAALGVWIAG